MRFKKMAAVMLTAGAMTLGSLALATPAQADSWVSACTFIWTPTSPGACVRATMGGKDFTNHKQWVGWVNTYRPGSGTSKIVKVEAWGDGFYFSSNAESATWGAQRWVSSGTNVCGATTYEGSTSRYIACFAVQV